MSRLVRWRIRRRKVRRAGLLHGWLSLPHGDSLPVVTPGTAADASSSVPPTLPPDAVARDQRS
ncbi:hypothetical protein [Pseudaeromonas pectinilytica]